VLLEPAPKFRRAELLEAAIEVFRAAGDRSAARRAAEELVEIAAGESSLMLEAIASRALGWIMLDEGDAADALAELRASAARWKKLDMPYEVARTRVLLGLACESLDDDVSARRELADARGVFESLGAGPDLVALGTHFERLEPSEPLGEGRGNLSSRELEVLAEVAAGRTNPEIAAALTISQHTVGRHLENIFSKLGVRSRAAATAHAYEHGLL
jgi:DNA-binding CsgD family transcriptional regulator